MVIPSLGVNWSSVLETTIETGIVNTDIENLEMVSYDKVYAKLTELKYSHPNNHTTR